MHLPEEAPAELPPPYTTDINTYADNLRASTHGPPLPDRGQGTAPPAHAVDLYKTGFGVEGTASRPTLSPLGAASPNKVNGEVAPADIAAAAQLARIPNPDYALSLEILRRL